MMQLPKIASHDELKKLGKKAAAKAKADPRKIGEQFVKNLNQSALTDRPTS